MKLQAGNLAFTTIVGDILPTAGTITFDDASKFPSAAPFITTIGSEIILFESRTGNVCTVASTDGAYGVEGRGYEGTTPSTHADGETIANKITAAYINNLWDEVTLNSTGGTVNGDMNVTGDLDVGGDVSISGNLSFLTSTTSTVTPEWNLDGVDLKNPTIAGYNEKVSVVSPTTAGVLTLDVEVANYFVATMTTAVDELVISNASTENATSITLEMILNNTYSTGFYFAWQVPYVIALNSTDVHVSTVDDSVNHASAGFSTDVKIGDVIAITGFTSDGDVNNDNWRVKSATANKILLLDEEEKLKSKAAGDTISIARRKEYFVETIIPDAPEPYQPVVFAMYSNDGERWKVAEVGEY